MPTGVSLQLFDGATPQASLTGLQALWWDVVEPKVMSRPVGKSTAVTTDASGYISLDLSSVTGLSPGDYGFLMLYKKDAADSNDSLVFSGKVQTSTVASGTDMYFYDSGWTRPADWLPLPDVTGLQMFAGLHRVYPDSNFCALSAAGNYTVDWGDGTVENIASGVNAYHQYDYTTFDLAETTLCSRGYKQALVTVVPQAGQNLTTMNLHVKHTQVGLQAYDSGFVDIAVAGALLTDLRVAVATSGASTQSINFSGLEQLRLVGDNGVSNFSYMFSNCYSLQSIPLLNTAAGTDFSYMFSNCYSLQSIPLLNTAAGTSFSYMFSNCRALPSIPLLNTAAGTNFSYMFSNCYSLQSIPLLNTAAGTSFSYMLSSCPALQSIPLLNTAAGTSFLGMFGNCRSLKKAALSGTQIAISYVGCHLSATALNEIYTNLATVTAQAITVTNNWGNVSDDPTIATSKGWTVTG